MVTKILIFNEFCQVLCNERCNRICIILGLEEEHGKKNK